MDARKRMWPTWLLVLLVGSFFSLFAGSGCEGDDPRAPAEGTQPDLNLTPGQVSLPFPSRYFTEPDATTATGERVTFHKALPKEVGAAIGVTEETTLLEAAGELDGFSILGPIMIPFDGPLDVQPWNDDDLGEFQEAGAGFARIYDITDRHRPESIGLWISFIEGENVLVLRPGIPLPAGHRILVALIGPLDDKAGTPVVRPALFDSVMGRRAGLPEDPFVEDLEGVRDFIESGVLPVDPADVICAFSYWTTARVDEIGAIREVLDEVDAANPILPEDIVYEDPRTITGKYRPPEFRLDGVIPLPPLGTPPGIQGENRIDFLLRLPEEFDVPFHPVISLHGINESRWDAETYDGFAVFSIDAVEHGDRLVGEPQIPYPFLDMMHPRKLRDNIRQTASDHMSLARMISHIAAEPESFGLPAGLLVEGSLSVVGGSLGGINGGLFSSIDPAVDNVVSLAGGGMFSEFLPDSVYGFFLPAGIHGLSPFEWLIAWHIVQAVLDPGDPTAAARGLILAPPEGRSSRNVLLSMVVGDRSVCNMASESFAWSAGVDVTASPPRNPFGLPEHTLPVEGNIEVEGGAVTGLLVEYVFDGTPSLLHGDFLDSTVVRAQAQHFLETALSNGVGRIIDPEAQ